MTAPVRPQDCGTVSTTAGTEASVDITAGDVDCACAEDLFDTYFNDPPTAPAGSGGYVVIDEWECITATFASGGGSACRTQQGDEVLARAVGDGAKPDGDDPGAEGDAEGDDSAVADDAKGNPIVDDFCSHIDDYTLGMMFPDGEQDEQACKNFIGGEVSIDQEHLDND